MEKVLCRFNLKAFGEHHTVALNGNKAKEKTSLGVLYIPIGEEVALTHQW